MPALTLLLALASANQPGKAEDASKCADPRIQPVRTSQLVQARPLRDEPSGKQYLGVVHGIDGCEKPIVIRENVK